MKTQKSLLASFLSLAFLCAPAIAQQQRQGYNQYGQYVGSPTTNPNIMPSQGINPNVMPYQSGYTNSPQGRYTSGYYYGQYPYANQPGYGYYGTNPYFSSFPALGAPVPVNGGLFRFNVGGFSGSYWKAPSGYYYPWGAGAIYATPPPVIVVQEGNSQVAQPAVADMLKDMGSYVEDQNTKKKFKSDDYQHLARRVRDLQNKESMMRSRNGGILDPNDEDTLRKDCAMLSGDISRRVIP